MHHNDHKIVPFEHCKLQPQTTLYIVIKAVMLSIFNVIHISVLLKIPNFAPNTMHISGAGCGIPTDIVIDEN